MALKVTHSHRIQLLRRALREGPVAFARLARMMLRDILLYQKTLVFALSTEGVAELPRRPLIEVELREYRSWEGVEPPVRKMLEDRRDDFWWNTQEWLSLGWRMWAGFVGGDLAIVCWTRDHTQSSRFCIPLQPDETLIWQTSTAAAYRGRGIFGAVLDHVVRQLTAEGNRRLYVCCLESNMASRRGIERCGFRPIGYLMIKAGGAWTWVPDLVEPGSGSPAHYVTSTRPVTRRRAIARRSAASAPSATSPIHTAEPTRRAAPLEVGPEHR